MNIFVNYAPPPPCSAQTVSQELLAAPLVPPQLSVKDFYMTGEPAVCSSPFLTKNLSKILNQLSSHRPSAPRLHQQGLADDGQVREGCDGRSGCCGRAIRLLKRHRQQGEKRTLVPSVI